MCVVKVTSIVTCTSSGWSKQSHNKALEGESCSNINMFNQTLFQTIHVWKSYYLYIRSINGANV